MSGNDFRAVPDARDCVASEEVKRMFGNDFRAVPGARAGSCSRGYSGIGPSRYHSLLIFRAGEVLKKLEIEACPPPVDRTALGLEGCMLVLAGLVLPLQASTFRKVVAVAATHNRIVEVCVVREGGCTERSSVLGGEEEGGCASFSRGSRRCQNMRSVLGGHV
mmetsp:Transcript_16736/g.33471  ORF Transcript_16736/g.33471 Transcript_16736/m.33471 type:complete len:163 (+) Transcript_16736:395-883(+)